MSTWWDIHSASFYLLFCIWTRDNKEYRHTATLCQFSCRWTRDNIYIPQLYINFLTDEHLKIFTDRKFMLTFMQMNTWWYKHAATFINFPAHENVMIYTYRSFISIFPCTRTRDDIYIPQLYVYFSADENVIIYTYRNLISTSPSMNTWKYHKAYFYINVHSDEHVII